MPSPDSAPYNGDHKLRAKEARAYYLYGWREIKNNREPMGVEQVDAPPPRSDDSRSPYRVYADALMEALIPRYVAEPLVAVDIGCGGGAYARLFKDFRGVYHGVDVLDYPKWEMVRQEAAHWPLKVEFHQLPAEQLAALPVQVTFSLSSSSLEHIDDPHAAVCGLAERSTPGSYGLHIVPAPWTLLTYGRHGWRRFSAEALKALFEEAGFECVKLYRLGGVPSTLLHFLWIACLEEGGGLQNITLSALPFILYRANSLIRFKGARTSRLTAPLYRALLRLALRLDRFFPKMASGYAILIRRKAEA